MSYMNSATTYETYLLDLNATRSFGGKLAKVLHPGTVVEMVGDIGTGKTTLVQAIAAAMGYTGTVNSPTFTLCNIYPISEKLSLFHYDLYRLDGKDMSTIALAEDMNDPEGIVFVEWASNVPNVLPADRISIELGHTGDGEGRSVLVKGTPEFIKQVAA